MDQGQGWGEFFKKNAKRSFPVVFFFFFFFFFFISFLGWQYAGYRLRSSVQGDIKQIQFLIEDQIETVTDRLESIVSLYRASQTVERDEFREFVTPYLTANPWIQALEWVPRVTAPERALFEETAKQAGFSDFRITENSDQKTLITASFSRSEYFPVHYLEPFQGNELALGFDLGSDPERQKALMLSASNGTAISTCPIDLVQEPTAQKGFLIFYPIYRNGEAIDSPDTRIKNLHGFALGVIQINKMAEYALNAMSSRTLDISLSEYKTGEHSKLFFNFTDESIFNSPLGRFVALLDGLRTKVSGSAYIQIADRRWVLTGIPSRSYWRQKMVLFAKMAVIGGLVVIFPLILLSFSLRVTFSEFLAHGGILEKESNKRIIFPRILNFISSVFKPSIWVMNRLKYPQKFILISGLFLLPLLLVMKLLISEMNDRINFSQKEIYGNEYLRPLKSMLVDVSEARRLAHLFVQGETAIRPKIISKASEINEYFPALEAVDKKYGKELKTAEKIENLEENWRYIFEKQRSASKEGLDDLYLEFLKDIRSLISYIGDTSNLILDPDLDTYYLMDSVLLKLPEQLDMLGKAQIFGHVALSDDVITVEERAELTRIQGVIRFNYEEAKRGLNVALQNNPAGNLSPVLHAPLKDFEAEVLNFVKIVDDEIIAKTDLSVTVQEFDENIHKVATVNSSLWDHCVRELDYLLEVRIKRFHDKEHFSKMFSQIALLLVGYFLIAFYMNVNKTVNALERFSKRMLRGDFEGKVALETQDELSRVVQSFNQVAVRLKNERDQARDESKRATEAETKAKASESRLKAINDSSPLGIYLTDAKGDCLYTNASYQKISGLTNEQALGKGWINSVHADDRERVYSEWYQAATHGGVYESFHRFSHADGGNVWAHVTAAQMKEGARVTGYVGVVEDITKRKELEVQLLQSQKLESVGRLAAGAAHEVKNPLAILLQGLDYLEKRDQCKQCLTSDVDLKSIVDEMKIAVRRADKVIHGLLDFSAPQQLQLEREGLNSLIIDSLRFVKHELDKSHIKAIEKLQDSLPDLMLDRNKIQQVFINVFVNAIHAMDTGGTLTVSTYLKKGSNGESISPLGAKSKSSNGHNQVFAEIEDTGKGIPESSLQKIFDPFFTTKPTGKGTGLGLSVVKSIVDLHGGTINITNRAEGGVRVTFAFPEAA